MTVPFLPRLAAAALVLGLPLAFFLGAAPAGAKSAAPAGAKSAAPERSAPRVARMTWGDRMFASSVRRELDMPGGGAPAVEDLTHSAVSRERIKPLQERLAGLDASTPPQVAAVAHADLANAFALRQLDEAAAAEYLAAIEADASFVPAWNNLGALLRRHGKTMLARRALDRALQLEPRNALAWFNLALLHEDEERFDAADDAYLKALSLEPALWLPSKNPLVIGNRRAQLALLRNYMAHGGATGSLTLDPSPVVVP